MSTIGRYHVEAELGRGAMGVVYLAADPQLQRRVAVKVYELPDGLSEAQHAEFRTRFAREARAAAGLSHPAIVTVHDAGEDAERSVPFIAMEHVDGCTLRDVLAKGPLDAERAREIANTIADGLHCAHEAGLVHRDVKPANILVRESDGAVKIADFGVARVPTSELTRSGSSVGSPAYMSPEQVQGRTVDRRSDLFSLAVVLYEMLTGRRPFAAEDPTALSYEIVHSTPLPVTRVRADLPRGLDRFFDVALHKEPERRFDDARRFLDALRAAFDAKHEEAGERTVVAADPFRPAPPAESRPRPRRRLFAAAALFGIVLTSWALWPARSATIKLDARSGFQAGTLTLSIDGEEVYARELSAPRRKHGFLKKVLDKDLESFETFLEARPGRREFEARIDLDDGAVYRETVAVEVQPGDERTLKLKAGKTFGSPLSLKFD